MNKTAVRHEAEGHSENNDVLAAEPNYELVQEFTERISMACEQELLRLRSKYPNEKIDSAQLSFYAHSCIAVTACLFLRSSAGTVVNMQLQEESEGESFLARTIGLAMGAIDLTCQAALKRFPANPMAEK